MRFRIHRGATEIGGSCVELQSKGASILLDLGSPLNAVEASPNLLPPVEGLERGGNADLLGVVLSHPHGDHYGLLACAHSSLPVYMGDGARRLLEAAAPFSGGTHFPQTVTPYRHRQTFSIGPFHVTPYLMDHSGFDSHALLVEADGHRLLYSGDLRAHGRKAWAFDAFVSDPPSAIDALLLEGTVLGRENSSDSITETELEGRIAASIQATDGLVLTCFSAQNIDRFVTIYKAAIRSGRQIVIDLYAACILDALALPSLPSPTSPSSRIRVFLPSRQKARIVRERRFDLLKPYNQSRIYPAEIAKAPERWAVMFRASMIADVASFGDLVDSRLIWSLWPGYLERDRLDLREWCREQAMGFEVQHTSGHADVANLVHFAEQVDARMTVPIHTQYPQRYAALFPNVRVCGDGEWHDFDAARHNGATG